ncbi:hypothetical protein [Mycolicibacterium sp. P1-5]|uniref:hypothetical protein n=1 Tax=Mycolicibacterium sp. P1-5 TaxID=2024617 RepID=UPI0018845C9E|nr:hypothetical protein [Mycolicibacterium sp. P1-5]
MVSTAEIAPGDGRTGNAVASDATGVTDPTVELADGEDTLTLPLDCAPDGPEVFAVESVELVVCADIGEPASDWAVPAFECFAPVLAPPAPTV